ncbi:hypothetical protein BDV97DRAFT_296160 [Delphinella strobiligena]|nr:hypothetical protein BDV97DRAFT_296160 [Delphinella strobiligena]
MTRDDLLSLAEGIREAITVLPVYDPIHACGSAPLRIIEARSDDVLSLAHEKLHTWKYSEVPTSWRRLYEEASLWKAISLILQTAHSDDHADDCITKLVYILDMAIILTGAPRHRQLIHQIFDSLKTILGPHDGPRTAVFPSNAPAPLPSDTFTRVEKLDFLAFQSHLDEDPKPLVMSGVMNDWPAVADSKHLWSDSAYLLQATLGGRRLVPVELGRSYTDEGWSQKIMTFGEYVRTYLLQPKQDQTGYLAQHDLFDQIPSLAADTRTPDYCYTNPPPPDPAYKSTVPVADLDKPLRNAWLGPAGTISTMHTDPYHNILCQVVGHKYIRLYPPSETPKLYPRGIDEAGVNMENTSHVDISLARKLLEPLTADGVEASAQLDESRAEFDASFPLFKDAKYIEGILAPGECLYIPVGWWHYVESLSTSFSMSFWWN